MISIYSCTLKGLWTDNICIGPENGPQVLSVFFITAQLGIVLLSLFLIFQFVACTELEISDDTSTKLDIDKPYFISEMQIKASTSESQF